MILMFVMLQLNEGGILMNRGTSRQQESICQTISFFPNPGWLKLQQNRKLQNPRLLLPLRQQRQMPQTPGWQRQAGYCCYSSS